MFSVSGKWKEIHINRDLAPLCVPLMEVDYLNDHYTLQRIHKDTRPTSHIFLARQPAVSVHRAPPPELLVRGLSYSSTDADSFATDLPERLIIAMEELEHALLDPLVTKLNRKLGSRLFINFVSEMSIDVKK